MPSIPFGEQDAGLDSGRSRIEGAESREHHKVVASTKEVWLVRYIAIFGDCIIKKDLSSCCISYCFEYNEEHNCELSGSGKATKTVDNLCLTLWKISIVWVLPVCWPSFHYLLDFLPALQLLFVNFFSISKDCISNGTLLPASLYFTDCKSWNSSYHSGSEDKLSKMFDTAVHTECVSFCHCS